MNDETMDEQLDALVARAHEATAIARYDEARDIAEEALTAARNADERRIEAAVLNILGAIERRTGKPDVGRAHHEAALKLARDFDLPGEIVSAINGLAHVDRTIGEYERSLALNREGLAVTIAHGMRDQEASSHNGLGTALESLGRYNEALEHYSRCLEIAEQTGNLRLRGYAYGNIAVIRQRLGDNAGALADELRSLACKEEAGDRWGLGVSYNNIGLIYKMLGEYAGALSSFLRSLEIAGEIGDREGESVALNNIGQVYEMLGDRTRVIDYYTRSLAISTEVGHAQGIAFSLTHIGRFYHALGDNARALIHYLKALRMHQQSGDRYGERGAQEDVGQIYLALGEHDVAAGYFARSLQIAREISDREGEVVALLGIGELERSLGRFEPAIATLEQGAALAREIGIGNLECDLLAALAMTSAEAGDTAGAGRYREHGRERARQLFNEESNGRVSALVFDFEGDHTRRQGEELGLDEDDLALVGAAIRKGAMQNMAPDLPTFPLEENRALQSTGPSLESAVDIAVVTFGEFRVTTGRGELGIAEWKRKRARELFKLLLVNHRRMLTIDEIIDTLWGNSSERNAEMLVMNTVSHIRSALEPERKGRRGSSYLISGDRAYMLDLGERSSVDFLRFKELMIAARRSSTIAERRRHYQAAAALYGGDFLKEDLYAEWSTAERAHLKEAFLEALEFLAGDHFRSGETEEAVTAACRALAADNTSERAWEILLRGLRVLGRGGEEARSIAECERAWTEELGVAVPARLRALFERR